MTPWLRSWCRPGWTGAVLALLGLTPLPVAEAAGPPAATPTPVVPSAPAPKVPASTDETASTAAVRVSATDTEKLLTLVGAPVIVEGDVIRTSDSKSGMNFLNFVQAMRTGFVVVTFPKDLQNFPDGKPKDLFRQKRIRVRGTLEKYKEQPQIILKTPAQIEVLGEAAPPVPAPAPSAKPSPNRRSSASGGSTVDEP